MRRFLAPPLVLVIALTGLVLTVSPAQAADTGNTAPQTGRIVSDEPGSLAPNILDGTVNSVAKVGNTIVVGGTFEPGAELQHLGHGDPQQGALVQRVHRSG